MHILKTVFYLFIISLACYNPFFPETGAPLEEVIHIMDTPSKTIQKLQQDYEYKNLNHFKDTLLFDNSFKYYVADNFAIGNELTKIKDFEILENELYVANTRYLVVKYSEEVRLHKNMFEKASDISFSQPLTIADSEIQYTDLDSMEAYAKLNETTITIELESGKVEFEIENQVFHLKKDTTDSQWKIYRWFELN